MAWSSDSVLQALIGHGNHLQGIIQRLDQLLVEENKQTRIMQKLYDILADDLGGPAVKIGFYLGAPIPQDPGDKSKPIPREKEQVIMTGKKDTPDTPIQDNQKAPYAIYAMDADGNPVNANPSDSAAISSSDTSSFTVVPDATPDPSKNAPGVTITPIQTGFIVAGAKVQSGVTLTIAPTLANPPASGQPQPTTVELDDLVGPEANAGFFLGAAVSQ